MRVTVGLAASRYLTSPNFGALTAFSISRYPALSRTDTHSFAVSKNRLCTLHRSSKNQTPRALVQFQLAQPLPQNLVCPATFVRVPSPKRVQARPMASVSNGNGVAAAKDERVEALREQMRLADGGRGVDAYIIPSEDPHMSEYPTDCDARRAFISRFTGSAGTVVVTATEALLWTDGRYFLQAEKELGPGWTLMRSGTPACPEIPEWLAEHIPEGGRVGIDPFLHTIEGAKKLEDKLKQAGRSVMPLMEGNLVDKVWGKARPLAPSAKVRVHPLKFAGESVLDKLAKLHKQMQEAKVGALLVTALDEVAWLLNLRGSDVSYNPVFTAYAIVRPDSTTLYIDPAKLTDEVHVHLEETGVETKDYGAMVGDVKAIAAAGVRMWADPTKVSFALLQAANEGAAAGPASPPSPRGKKSSPPPAKRKRGENAPAGVEEAPKPGAAFLERASPVTAAKAIKNEAELAGMREAHLRDAVALAQTLLWVEQQAAAGVELDEVKLDEYLTGRRAEQEGFIEPSFPTIAGAGPNGAIIHYRAEAPTAAPITSSTLLLVDSGGQYDCGTTDVTRTIHLGTPTAHQKMCFTRVLQGHIALDAAVFPEGTPGLALDTLARSALWSEGLNYRHGTGHGVGAALNVHEGPHSISTRYYITTPLEAGMIVSNEPGYYEDGAFGIRIENLLAIREAATPFRFGGQSYFCFDRLTLCPIQRKMIDIELLSKKEIDWINAYHAEVWEKVSPRLSGEVLEWLKSNTAPIEVPRLAVAAA
eukprot:jgi/Botrbrau1/18143/Bobra.53_1s0015.2